MKPFFRSIVLLFIYFCSNTFVSAASDDLDSIPRLVQRTPISAFESPGAKRDTTLLDVNLAILTDLSLNRLNKVVIPVIDKDLIFKKTFQKIRRITSTWIGKDDKGNTSVLLTIGADHFFGRVVTDDTVMVFEPIEDSSQVVSSVLDTDFEIPLDQDEMIPPLPSREFISARDTADDGSRIDVMVLYTTGMATAYPGSQIDTRIQYLIDLANISFSNSNIDTQYNLVYSQEVDYPDDSAGDMSQALNDLTNNSGVFSNVETLRTTYGADQVTLLRRFVDEGCGMAWVLTSDYARYAYTVVQDGSKADGSCYYCSLLAYAHEIGHNLGCVHDRDNTSITGRFSYSYGYQDPDQLFRTVMAYDCPSGCQRLSHFSNPDVIYDGNPTGIADPEPDSADNAKTINQTRVEMAGYRAAVQPRTTVITPNGSEQWPSGTSQTISWTSSNFNDDIKIELFRSGLLDSAIAPSAPNAGSYSWHIPLSQSVDSNYRIRISSASDPDIFDESDGDFSITETRNSNRSIPWIQLLLLSEE